MADGQIMWFRTSTGKCVADEGGVSNVCAAFWHDVNGSKAPNTFGKDIFLYVMSSDGIFPNLNNDCRKTQAGPGCSGYIIKNNNMNYLH